jgi:hypothetical protein
MPDVLRPGSLPAPQTPNPRQKRRSVLGAVRARDANMRHCSAPPTGTSGAWVRPSRTQRIGARFSDLRRAFRIDVGGRFVRPTIAFHRP